MNLNYEGSLHLIIGPMFSGKTTELIRLKQRSKNIGNKTISIKYQFDNRYGNDNYLHTHDGMNDIALLSCGKSLTETINSINLNNYNEIYIDEIQFYEDADKVCENLANMGKNVIACGLIGDYNRIMFPMIAKILPKSDKVTILTSLDKNSKTDCMFTKYINDENKLKNNNNELIGANEYYISCNRKTFFLNH